MNKKKRSYLFAGLGTILILAIVALRLTNALQFYKIPTPSSEFTIARNSLIFGSRWVEPRRLGTRARADIPQGLERRPVRPGSRTGGFLFRTG